MSLDLESRIRNVTAVLGPTNTGKTHLAIERMLGHDTGLIGLLLRLLAREVYDKVAARAGVGNVALITGEETIKPERPRYWVWNAVAWRTRRQRGVPAVVLGALSPRTRNAQVALYQSGDVDFLVATDAIGMGLNLDVDHVAFAGTRKFDGQVHRELTAGELGQIAGRAGRHMNDGTFGVTGAVEPLSSDLIDRLEHQ